MNLVDNWFNNYEVAEIFAKERNCKLIANNPTLDKKIMFLEYKLNKTINYLPVNSYSSIEISNNDLQRQLKELEEYINSLDITAIFVPTISKSNPNNFLPLTFKKFILPD